MVIVGRSLILYSIDAGRMLRTILKKDNLLSLCLSGFKLALALTIHCTKKMALVVLYQLQWLVSRFTYR